MTSWQWGHVGEKKSTARTTGGACVAFGPAALGSGCVVSPNANRVKAIPDIASPRAPS